MYLSTLVILYAHKNVAPGCTVSNLEAWLVKINYKHELSLAKPNIDFKLSSLCLLDDSLSIIW